jgi:hypothetical protein
VLWSICPHCGAQGHRNQQNSHQVSHNNFPYLLLLVVGKALTVSFRRCSTLATCHLHDGSAKKRCTA